MWPYCSGLRNTRVNEVACRKKGRNKEAKSRAVPLSEYDVSISAFRREICNASHPSSRLRESNSLLVHMSADERKEEEEEGIPSPGTPATQDNW